MSERFTTTDEQAPEESAVAGPVPEESTPVDPVAPDGATDDLLPGGLAPGDGLDLDDVPDGVDRAALDRMDFLASLLDDGLEIPGTKRSIGLDPLVGVLPVAGDAVIAVVSLFIPLQAALLGVRKRTLLRMVANIGIDFAGGSVPLVGDVFDWFWKANRKNVNLALRDLDVERA